MTKDKKIIMQVEGGWWKVDVSWENTPEPVFSPIYSFHGNAIEELFIPYMKLKYEMCNFKWVN